VTVRCPRCDTLYRRPARGGTDAPYRCARCRHVFEVAPDEPEVLGGPQDLDAADEPAFAFEDEPEPEERAEPAAERRSERLRVAAEKRPPPAPPPRRAEPPPPRVTTLRFAVRSSLAVCLGYALVSVWAYTNPVASRALLARVPVIGTALLETRLDPTSIQLANVRGEYQRVKGDRLVFVIAGSAVNTSPMPVKRVQVEGRIAGVREQRQVVFCGAAPRDLQDLSLREIALLQTLEPPADWALGPAEQADFLVVFATPPPDLREFSAEVVAVRAEPRRSGAPARSAGATAPALAWAARPRA
jgi:hypothetical protein